MTEMGAKPRLVPGVISCWAGLVFFMFVLAPTNRAVVAQREAYPTYATVMSMLVLCALAGTIWAAIGAARLRRTPTTLALAVLLGYPVFLVAKAFVTGYFSTWVLCFLVFIIAVNGLCSCYLLRPSIRSVWSSTQGSAAA